jgi:ribose transport system permease protein
VSTTENKTETVDLTTESTQIEAQNSTAPTALKRHKGPWRSFEDVSHRTAVIGLWIIMFFFFVAIEPSKMLQSSAIKSIFDSQEPLVFLSLAALATLSVGEFDLSVASVLGLCAVSLPVLVDWHGMNVILAVFITLGIGVAAGTFNAFVTVVVGVEGFVVTLGSGSILIGIASWISNDETVSGLPNGLTNLANTQLFGLPLTFYYGVALALIIAYIASFTPLGRRMTFVGANREVARLAGVRVDRIRFCSYVVGSTIAALGGILLVASLGGFQSSSATIYLLPAISAVFLGTAVIQPGRFNTIGCLVGVYFLATGILGLQLLGLGGWIQNVFYGAALVVAVAVSTLVRRRRGR